MEVLLRPYAQVSADYLMPVTLTRFDTQTFGGIDYLDVERLVPLSEVQLDVSCLVSGWLRWR